MEQRRLRLGDILDDYCPRERRVTNHAVVAMIEEDVKQTRCTTCDAEHAYKHARVPRKRKKETSAALFKEVLAGMPETVDVPEPAAAPTLVVPFAVPVDAARAISRDTLVPINTPSQEFHPPMHNDDNDQHDELREADSQGTADERQETDAQTPDTDTPKADGPVHRPLIRATLPRPEGQKDTRPVPEFTVRHSGPRGNTSGNFRGPDRARMRTGGGNGHGMPNGNRPQNSGSRFQGNRTANSGRQQAGRAAGFRNSGTNAKRGRGSRG